MHFRAIDTKKSACDTGDAGRNESDSVASVDEMVEAVDEVVHKYRLNLIHRKSEITGEIECSSTLWRDGYLDLGF
jgi:hypothetical protein